MQSTGFPFITPSSTCMSEDLLFFDTFSHSNSDKDNFDLVQFPSPVVIDLIKIVPLGQPIEAKIPGSVRLGATNPSKCELEFFINDLTKQDAHTMTDLGKFFCSEKETDFSPPLQIQTDGLLLRGSYRTLTLAIFGQIAAYDEKPEDDPAILSAASPPAQTPASPVASERDISYHMRSVDHELLRQVQDDEESVEEESTMKSGEILLKDESMIDNGGINEDAVMDLVENDPLKNQSNLEESSNDEVGVPATFGPNDKTNDEIEYSMFSDLEESSRRSIKEEVNSKQATDIDAIDRLSTTDQVPDIDAKEWHFNVDSYSPKPLVYFPDPSLTLQERTLLAHRTKSAQRNNHKDSVDKEVEKVKEMFEVLGCSDESKTEDWVTLVEDLTNDITNMSLSQTVSNEDMLRFLVKQVLCGLDMNLALGQKQTGFKVRHLKAGIKLATILFHCGQAAVSILLQFGIPQKVLQIYNQNQMSLPLRLLIFKCLNAACDTVDGIEHVINHNYDWDDACSKLNDLENVATNTKPEQHHEDSKILTLNQQQKFTCYQYMIIILLSKPTTRVTIAIGNLIKKIRFYSDLAQLNSLIFESQVITDESEDSVFESEQPNCLGDKNHLDKAHQVLQDIVNLMRDKCFNIAQPVRYLPARVQFHVKPNTGDNHLAVYKWFKHFRLIDCLNKLLASIKMNDPLDIEQGVKLQGLTLTLIQKILDSPRGTQWFLSNDTYDSTTCLLRTLAQRLKTANQSSLRMPAIENLPDALLCREESLSAAGCRDMSLKLSYHFKVFSCIDKLFDFHRELLSKRTEQSTIHQPERMLHQLYIMSNHPYGLAAIMKYFSCIGNLDCILRFLDIPEADKHLEFVKETSIDYVMELLGTFFRLNNNVLEISEEYLDTLVELCKTKDKNLCVRIKSLLPWLSPFETDQPFPLITYSEETFRQLTRIIRKSIPDCSIPFAQGFNFELPPQMITAVRILRQLCIPPQVESFIDANFDAYSTHRLSKSCHARSSSFLAFVDSLPHQQNLNQSWNLNPHTSRTILPIGGSSYEDSITDQLGQLSNLSKLFQPYDESICGDLKYHYGVMQVFEQEGLRRLLNTLRELTGNYPRPVYQSAALGGFRGRIVISYVHTVIVLLHSITCHLIDARGKEFKDTSIIPVVLETYSLLCFVPKPDGEKISELMKRDDLSSLQKSIDMRSDNYQLAQRAKKLILSILMSYTQMCLSVSESEENVISKSMWTKMLKEVIDFTLSTPVFFQHGLDVLTKILPAPLPSSSVLDSIDQEQLFKNINHRKLWSAHLHPLHQKIEQMISDLSLCYQSNIRSLLYYLCNQLCDLSSNASCMVAKIITDTLITCAAKLSFESNGDATHPASEHNQSSGIGAQQQMRQADDKVSVQMTSATWLGTKESKFAIKMILNLLSNMITNQAFETAFSNHLQVVSKKDEKLLANLQNIVKFQEEYRPNEATEEINQTNVSNTTVTNLIESIRMITESNTSKENFAHAISVSDVTPSEELTKINLLEMARKTSDRFNLTTGITKTYRLKVLLDMNSRAHRANDYASKRFERATPHNYQELMVPTSHKAYTPPIRGRGRAQARPDSFRSRPQNTSRPPSIHVDDFVDIYNQNDNPGQASGSSRYSGGAKIPGDYRSSGSSRGHPDMHGEGALHRHPFFSPQQPPSHSGKPPNYHGGRSHAKSKYMKSK